MVWEISQIRPLKASSISAVLFSLSFPCLSHSLPPVTAPAPHLPRHINSCHPLGEGWVHLSSESRWEKRENQGIRLFLWVQLSEALWSQICFFMWNQNTVPSFQSIFLLLRLLGVVKPNPKLLTFHTQYEGKGHLRISVLGIIPQ